MHLFSINDNASVLDVFKIQNGIGKPNKKKIKIVRSDHGVEIDAR